VRLAKPAPPLTAPAATAPIRSEIEIEKSDAG
jgi:hypothetical protein